MLIVPGVCTFRDTCGVEPPDISSPAIGSRSWMIGSAHFSMSGMILVCAEMYVMAAVIPNTAIDVIALATWLLSTGNELRKCRLVYSAVINPAMSMVMYGVMSLIRNAICFFVMILPPSC